MHLTTTNPVPGVWRQNTRAGVILAISFTRLSRRNARISAHTMRMRAYARIPAHAMRMRAYARIPAHAMRRRAFLRMRCECAHFAHAMRMLAHARISPHAMRCDAMRMRACDAMRMRASRGNLCVSGTVPDQYIKVFTIRWIAWKIIISLLMHMLCLGFLILRQGGSTLTKT